MNNPKYQTARSDPTRQVRTHTCFSYCTNGQDPAVLGDDRPDCVDLPPSERDQIICVNPIDECEKTTVSSEVYLSTPHKESNVFSPWLGFLAMLAANPV